ncbi:family 43 glycosylhydrolase [Gorillibacterium massiliense]|uniref:family 43 glycosylhydrolase n=1 Tax=Gorillibacterium massiliense TaxID=1280390 RepID=UPI0004BBF4CC|nr:family 43 glycosylhydrolase [Gorillibacterium massiliense]
METRNHAAINGPVAGNPYVPGYWGDTNVFYDNGTFYMNATTDGYDTGEFTNGPTFGIWKSTDFVNWTFKNLDYPENFPYTSNKLWAPSMTKGPDGRFYMYYIRDGYNCYVASASDPFGSWRDENGGQSIHPDMFDTDVFKDTDGSYYLVYMGPAIDDERAVYLGKLASDMVRFEEAPTVIFTGKSDPNLFEGPGIFKRNGIYYLTYSAGSLSGSYNVRATLSTESIYGPYNQNPANPILSPDSVNHLLCTGHNNCFAVGEETYIAYHRMSYPRRSQDMFRQAAAEKMVFNADGTLQIIVPGTMGVGALAPLIDARINLALGKTVTASSMASTAYSPDYVVDDNFSTMWKAASNSYPQWLQIDLGAVCEIGQIATIFEYLTESYTYKIELSSDGMTWPAVIDRSMNSATGIMVDAIEDRARYVKLTIFGSTKTDFSPGVWTIKLMV